MIKFKEKQFVLPLAAIPVGAWLAAGGTAATVGLTVADVSKSSKARKAEAKKNEIHRAEVLSAINNLSKTSPELAKKAENLVIPTEEISLKKSKNSTKMDPIVPTQTAYSILGAVTGLGKVGWGLLKARGGRLAGDVAIGGAMAGGAILADKYVRNDMKKSGLEVPINSPYSEEILEDEQKEYSISPVAVAKRACRMARRRSKAAAEALKEKSKKEAAAKLAAGEAPKSVLGGIKDSLPMVGLLGTATAAPIVMGYNAEKQMLLDQSAGTRTPIQNNYSVVSAILNPIIRRVGSKEAIKVTARATRMAAKRAPGVAASAVKKTARNTGKSVKIAALRMKRDPLRSTLAGISNLTMGGGRVGTRRMGHSLVELGTKHGSSAATKAGELILKNPTAAVAASIPAGLAVTGATFGAGEKIVSGVSKKLDKNTLAYQNSKEQLIQ